MRRIYHRRSAPGYAYRPYGGRRRLTWQRVLALLLITVLAAFAALRVVISIHARSQIVGEPQVMVIFGSKVEEDGPARMLKDRLDCALDYLEDHPDMTVVVTGGKGDDEHVSEAQGMYDYLTAHGVDGEQILQEPQSRNTWQNVNYTLTLMEGEGYDVTDNVLLVSSGFHLARIEMLWDRARDGMLAGEIYRAQYISTLAAPVGADVLP